MATFIVDCKYCKAKVAAQQHGIVENCGMDHESGELHGSRLFIGKCPRCSCLIAAHSDQIGFEGVTADTDEWSEAERVFPDPDRTFTSYRVPRSVKNALSEANKTLGAGATTAACVMFGRALEAVCRDNPRSFRTTDGGYFGAGSYFSLELEYATRYAMMQVLPALPHLRHQR